MQLEENFTIPFSQQTVWAAFQNLELIVSCLPGAKLISPASETPLQVGFQVKLGPIVANFTGSAEVTFDAINHGGSFKGQGSDQKSNSRVKGEAKFSLLSIENNHTKVIVNTEFFLSGSLAQFGRIGILKEVASIITAQFAENLKNNLELPIDSTETVSSVNIIQDKNTATSVSHTSLNIFSLLFKLITNKLHINYFLKKSKD